MAKTYRIAALAIVAIIFVGQVLTGEHDYTDVGYSIIAALYMVAAEIVDLREGKR